MERDKWAKKAQKEGFVARSSYKLKQLNKKYNLIRKGDKVLDLGCSPGSWAQVCLQLGANRVTGVDMKEVKINASNFSFILQDVYGLNIKKLGKFDVVLSDLAPSTSGVKNLDAEESISLSNKAFNISRNSLKPQGNFLVKVFQGKGFDDLLKKIKKSFEFCKSSKPTASKSKSKEIYIVCKGFKS